MIDIKGYEGLYKVLEYGEVFSYRSQRNLKKCISGKGYYSVGLSNNGKTKLHLVHRLVALFFIPVDNPEELQVNHKNGIKTDNRKENLEWCTNKENSLHAYKMGLMNQDGENHSGHKLTQKQVDEIRKKYSTKRIITQAKIGSLYGVSREAIKDILNGRNWPKSRNKKRKGK